MFSGQPRVDRVQFNGLLTSKLSELRSKLGTSSTPAGAPALVASWINKLLLPKKTTTRSKKNIKSSTSEQNVRKTKDAISFVPPQTELETSDRVPTAMSVSADSRSPSPEPKEFEITSLPSMLSMMSASRTYRPSSPTSYYKFNEFKHSSFSSDDLRSAKSTLQALPVLRSLSMIPSAVLDKQLSSPQSVPEIVSSNVMKLVDVIFNLSLCYPRKQSFHRDDDLSGTVADSSPLMHSLLRLLSNLDSEFAPRLVSNLQAVLDLHLLPDN